jgi:protein gp37
MAEHTGISWTDHSWSPWYGCTQISMGGKGACENCYARHLSETRMGRVVFGGPGRGEGTRDARAESAWKEPLRWNKTAEVDRYVADRETFVFPSMCDPFDNHHDLPPLRARFFDLIRATPHLTWLLLTKRPQMIERLWFKSDGSNVFPKNVILMCTVVTQEEANRDIPHLLAAAAAFGVRAGVSMEPLMEAVDLTNISTLRFRGAEVLNALTGELSGMFGEPAGSIPPLSWVICGGETDQGKHKARPSHPDWFRNLRDQCAERAFLGI